MQDRRRKILKSAIKEYRRTGQPVSSQGLFDRYRFDFSPATVRAEMLALDDEGYLEQPHTSAGRLPTDKAYRFFIEEFYDESLSHDEKEEVRQRMEQLRQNSLREMAQFLADCTRSLAISGSFGRLVDFHEAGLKWLAEEPQSDENDLREMLRYFDSMEEDFNKFFGDIEEEVKIFIGRENPIKYLRNYSLVITGFEDEDEKMIFGVIGPKRMDYRKNMFVLEEAKKKIKNRQ